MALALATLNLDPAISGFKIKLARLVVFMVSHQSSCTVGALLGLQGHKRVQSPPDCVGHSPLRDKLESLNFS